MSTFEEIQVGYTVRSTRNGVTREGIVEAIGPKSAHTKWPVVEIANIEDDSIEIVDRPAPPIKLPSVPTLGWLNNSPDLLAIWVDSSDGAARPPAITPTCIPTGFDDGHITVFTPATAVPTEALDELRAWKWPDNAARAFLAAVDNASTR